MHRKHVDAFTVVCSPKPIIDVNRWLDTDGQNIIIMIHDDNTYTMQVAAVSQKEYDRLIETYYEPIKNYIELWIDEQDDDFNE